MNMNRVRTPPDNAKILPDMYNILDAHAAKRTSSMNGVLDFQLTTKHNVISRHRYQAERIHREEKARITNVLSHIRDKLPAVERIRDFDIKFFKDRSIEEQSINKKTKSHNSYNKNVDPICLRCYKHHFAIQKNQLTNSFVLPSIPRNRRLPPTLAAKEVGTKPAQQPDQCENNTENQFDPLSTNSYDDQESEIPNFLSHNKGADKDGSRDPMGPPLTPTKQAFGWWMPRNKTYQFLQKDRVGREIDVNKHYTPRLMPYEDWKNIVRDVCANCSRPGDCFATRQPSGSLHRSSNK